MISEVKGSDKWYLLDKILTYRAMFCKVHTSERNRCITPEHYKIATISNHESGFLQYKITKTQYRNKMDAEADLRLQTTPII
jgi:hypothetical protein